MKPPATIPLWRRGVIVAWALVDECDAGKISERSWSLNAARYAVSAGESMHRTILGCKPGDGVIVDHVNGLRTDNRRSNLRAVSILENANNRGQPYSLLRELRLRGGLTQRELAERQGVTQGAIAQTERRTDVLASTLRSVATATGNRVEFRAAFSDATYTLRV